jgi:uncharacterized membrane protein
VRLASRSWPWALNVLVAAFIGGALLAPILERIGLSNGASAIYSLYHLTCHQWAFRSFFLFGSQLVYGREQLNALSVDPYTFTGTPDLGWKLAFCERDLAIYVAALAVGLWFAQHRDMQAMSVRVFAPLILPMALDGFTQLFGWRESTWELRVLTGVLFGAASAWFLYPRFEVAFGGEADTRPYAPENVCAPQPPR